MSRAITDGKTRQFFCQAESPGASNPGDEWLKSTDSSFWVYSGTAWVQVTGGGGGAPGGDNLTLQFNNNGAFGMVRDSQVVDDHFFVSAVQAHSLITDSELTLGGTYGSPDGLTLQCSGIATQTLNLPQAAGSAGQSLTIVSESQLAWVNVLIAVTAPAGPGAAGSAGQVSFDSNYFYVCYGPGAWTRFAKDATWV